MKRKEVLLLNSTLFPIMVISLQKAITLLAKDKISIVGDNRDKRVRTINKKFDIYAPEIVKLKSYVHIPYKPIHPSKRAVFQRDDHTCQYCGTNKDLTIDHILPVSKGGKNTWNNLVTACRKCNSKKGNLLPNEAGMSLLKEPKTPLFVVKSKESWEKYLFK